MIKNFQTNAFQKDTNTESEKRITKMTNTTEETLYTKLERYSALSQRILYSVMHFFIEKLCDFQVILYICDANYVF